MDHADHPRVLLVDDDERLLDSLVRLHGRHFTLSKAAGGREGIRAIERDGPFALVVVDLQMPGFDGMRVLEHCRQTTPDTVRVMLTGQADLEVAKQAVNEGQVFRFLTKPCSAEEFAHAVEAGLRHHALMQHEREVLDKTVRGTVQALVDVLSLVRPTAFAKARRVQELARRLAAELGLRNPWLHETAALLSQVGVVAVPPRILADVESGGLPSPEELDVLADHPLTAAEMLRAIPRLEGVAEILVQEHSLRNGAPRLRCSPEALIGGRLLHLALDLDEQLTAPGADTASIVERMRTREDRYGAEILAALDRLDLGPSGSTLETHFVRDLPEGWFLAEDLVTEDGEVLMPRGQQVSNSVRARIGNHVALGELDPDRAVLVTSSLVEATDGVSTHARR
ncbi:MAG: response regulator [Planctomycetota bacterium]|nr:response regulator [Planctomycetota bacterium]MDA0932627.1 response regulator [Planctomycetota bacterium]MDA1220621.1 response regulator [Planctomycetota bacterium]